MHDILRRPAPAGLPSATIPTIAELEARHDRRIGLYARNLRTGQALSHRPEERFAMCSTFKPFAAAALLSGRLVTPDRDVLRRRIAYPPSLVAGDVWAPSTRKWLARGYAPSVFELAAAAVRDSDNGAVNIVLQLIGGPGAVTEFVRDLGDKTTRLDRWEPAMSEFAPGQLLDTSTPRALGQRYVDLLLGRALKPRARRTITGWLIDNTTDPPFRKALPKGWRIADKTGSGGYATRNDVGVTWTDRGVPILVSCMTRADNPDVERLSQPLTDAFAVCAERLS